MRSPARAGPFPYDEPLFGVPQRPDLAFVVLEKALAAGPVCAS